jgi:flagellar hook-associated protein 3 FlgL
MKVSTSQIFERAMTQMSTQQAKVSDLQTQLATGKQIVRPSDDPDKAGLIQRLTTANTRQEGYQNNLNAISARLGAEEAALSGTERVIQRVRELAVQAKSDTLSPANRQIIAAEVSALREELLSLSNSSDTSGNYIFSGAMTKTAPFSADAQGVTVYQGDIRQMMVDVSDQRQLTLNRPGNEVYASVLREASDGSFERVGFFAVIDDFTDALNSNDTDQIELSLGEVSELGQNLSLSLADLGSRMSIVESQADAIAETKLRYNELLSSAGDLDYASAVTSLTSEIMSLEAGQSSFAKISQLSLFDYIR